MTQPLIALLLISACLIADILTDGTAPRDPLTGKWNINHTRGAIIRLLVAIPVAWLDWHSLFLWLPFMPLFDFGVNLMRGLPALYRGTTSFLDRNVPVWLKWGMGCAGMVTYLIL